MKKTVSGKEMHHPVVGQADMRRQCPVHFPMQSHLMTHVDKARFASLNPLNL